ncbi:protein ovarian tumor locus [Elysia marginata]|uniref:Protein ovarian tumor locus n=1 Tax=Elysia marginata TaxID=1093978 RepID=A0AAV4FGH9_9GAST|nr:protein ovarian tumor locus [Elysia marginata]
MASCILPWCETLAENFDPSELSCFLSDVISLFGADKTDTLKKLCGRSSPPVPFRIAKALHPALFRNVELDIVQEEKREARLRNLGLSSGFSPGDKCQVSSPRS